MKKGLREIIQIVILAVIIFVVLQATLQTYDIKLRSMEPSLTDGERVLVNKAVYFHLGGGWGKLIFFGNKEGDTTYMFHQPHRGEIIIFYPPNGSEIAYVKRIIGVPGDIVEIRDGKVYLNESPTPLNEPYVKHPSYEDMRAVVVPPGHYFVMGDNRSNSADSRTGWTVPYQNIIGKASLTIWPLGEFGGVPNYSYD